MIKLLLRRIIVHIYTSVHGAMSIADNEVKSGAVNRSPDICTTAEENPEKSKLENCLMKTMRPVITSHGVPYLQVSSVS